MKTAELIDAIAADVGTPPKRLRPALFAALAMAAIAAAVVFFATLSPRPDIAAAADAPRFWLKFAVTGATAAAAAALALRLARPGADPRTAMPMLVFAATLLVGAAAVELMTVPADQWSARLMGRNWWRCLGLIPLLSAAPLGLILLVMRRGAPGSPARLGAAAGLLAGAIGASFYALHCVDDSPLFVGAWYPIGMASVSLAGAALGSRLLRW